MAWYAKVTEIDFNYYLKIHFTHQTQHSNSCTWRVDVIHLDELGIPQLLYGREFSIVPETKIEYEFDEKDWGYLEHFVASKTKFPNENAFAMFMDSLIEGND